MDFSDFVRGRAFPHCVCVTQGGFVSKQVQICRGDVLILKSCDVEQVTLCFQDKNDTSEFSSAKVNVTFDACVKFKVLPPTDADTNDIMYPTIADLLLDCPTHFEATTPYDDPYLPGMSVNLGDRFWFVRIITDSKNGQERLQVRDSKDNIVILSQDCRGHFRPLKDENEYTLRELLDMAPVQRRLLMVQKDAVSGTNTICNNFQETMISEIENKTTTQLYSQNSTLTSLELETAHQHQPFAPYGIVYMQKPELNVIVSPHNDPETTWVVPENANLKVRTYSQNDYEVPVSTFQQYHTLKKPLDDEVPIFRAPSAPSLPQPQIPIEIRHFVDIYCSSFPVTATVVNLAEAHPFFQQMLRSVEEMIICRLDQVKRLYVKDTKSDAVFGLSTDVRLSFVEYPQQFKIVSELVCLPIGSEVIVLEDIAADFPKPLSLRFGDILRVTSNIPCVIKTKLGNRDCQVIKCDRIDPEGSGNIRLKLPLDFEVTMLLKTDQNCSRLISVHDLVNGVVPLPSQNVTCVSEDANNEAINELPADLQILKCLKETCIVAKPSSTVSTHISQSARSHKEDMAIEHCSSHESAILPNIGIPLTSGLVLVFRQRLHVYEPQEEASVEVFMSLPIEKMTVSQFEERQRHLKEHSDYEDVESGSSSTTDEYESTSNTTTRDSSDGILERKQKNAKLDTVRRFSQALNPKYWRQTKTKPLPLPYPSALGPTHFTITQNRKGEMGSTSVFYESTNNESTSLEFTTRDKAEDENLYEELEIRPCKATMSASQLCENSTFSLPEYVPLPPSNNPPQLVPKHPEKQALAVTPDTTRLRLTGAADVADSSTTSLNDSFEGCNKKNSNDIYTQIRKWANNLGNSMGSRFSLRFKEDTLRNNTINHVHNGVDHGVTRPEKTDVPDICTDASHCDSNLSLTPRKSQNEFLEINDQRNYTNESLSSFTLQQESEDWSVSANDITETQTERQEEENSISISIDLNQPVASKTLELQVPKPKPRNLNKYIVFERDQCCPVLPQITNEQISISPRDFVEGGTLSVVANLSSDDSEVSLPVTVPNSRVPKPLPKPRNSTRTKV